MPASNLAQYTLGPDGAIHHWLACGPVTSPLPNFSNLVRANASPFGPNQRWVISNVADSLALKAKIYQEQSRLVWKPGPTPALHQTGPRGQKQWQHALAEEDQMVDFGLFNFTLTRMESWLFVRLHVDETKTIKAELLTVGPTHIWINGQCQIRHLDFGYVEPLVVPISLTLTKGWNDVWLYGEMLGWREARLALGLRLLQPPLVTIGLPLGNVPAEAWHRAENDLAGLHLKQFAFPTLPAQLWLNPDAPQSLDVIAKLSLPLPEDGIDLTLDGGQLTVPEQQAQLTLHPGQSANLPITGDLTRMFAHLPTEHYLHVQLCPVNSVPFTVNQEIWVGRNTFHRQPYGDYETRRRAALEHLAQIPHQINGAIAAVETGQATIIEPEAVSLACQFLENRFDCADFYAIGLLTLVYRYNNQPVLRPQDLRRIEDAFHHFKFWIDEPGLDAMCYHTENHQILFHVTAYLAGQLWPNRVFTNSGWTGRQQKVRARQRIVEWILRRLRGNFSEWDSNAYLTLDAYAMLALTEFADSPRLREMATALLHKIFFILACQSWRGIHGCTHGRAYVTSLKTARIENTSGLQNIAWGLGNFNSETRATGLLALARRYRVPHILQKIGADMPDLLVTRARSAGRYRPQFDLKRGPWEVNTLTYRTPGGMLSAAVDYLPGIEGWQEHLWQATLSPEAVVFTTHPGNSQENEVSRPNFWAGSARLPRVAMADRTVICLYNMALKGGLNFTHAYFPTTAFDEYHLEGAWAFGRVGDGYVALWGDGNLHLTATGRHAGQELRSSGPGQVWLCYMGLAAVDGNFTTFCKRVSQTSVQVEGVNLRWTTPDGQTLAFGWEEPLLVNGTPQQLSNFPHYDNLYTHTPLGADQMKISHNGQQLVLDLSGGRVLT